MVENLLSNALKFGAGELVTVRLRSDGRSAQLDVQDRGIGISPDQQAELYARSPSNIVRVELGKESPRDNASDNRYTRAAAALAAWRRASVLVRSPQPSLYIYRHRFDRQGRAYNRLHCFALVRLEEWDNGTIRPHEYTFSGPKADRLELVRATRTQVSPVFSLFRAETGSELPLLETDGVVSFEADGQHHTLAEVHDAGTVRGVSEFLSGRTLYIADGHHRYETALAYRDEVRKRASKWTGEEPENFVLMALSAASDPGLLVLPTHRLLNLPSVPADALDRLLQHFVVEDVTWHDVEEVYVVRRALELQAVALLPDPYPARDLQTLRRLHETAARPGTDPAEYYELNREFHRGVLEPASNDLLKRMLNEIWDLPVSHRIFRHYMVSGANVRQMIAEHEAILETAEANDRVRLAHLVDRHLQEAQAETSAWLSKG